MKMEMSEAEFIAMMKLLQENQNALPNFLEKGMDAIVKFLDNEKMSIVCPSTVSVFPKPEPEPEEKVETIEKEEIITPRKKEDV